MPLRPGLGEARSGFWGDVDTPSPCPPVALRTVSGPTSAEPVVRAEGLSCHPVSPPFPDGILSLGYFRNIPEVMGLE